MLGQESGVPSMSTGLFLQRMARQADGKEDFLQEEAAARQGEQGPGPSAHAHYTRHRPPLSGLPSGERIPRLGRLLG